MAELVRTLSLRDLVLLIIGAVIGSGIFIIPGAVLRSVDASVGVALLVWVFGGILSLLGALTYGELSARNPNAGGLYNYIRDGFGSLPAFVYGWTLFFVIGSGATATLASAFSAYLNQIVQLSPVLSKLVSILMIAVVTLVNIRGTRRSSDLQNWTTAMKVSAILIMSIALLVLGRNSTHLYTNLWPDSWSIATFSSAGVAMIGVLWAYEGWQFATFSGSEVIHPARNYPRAFLAGLLTLIFIYLIANLSYVSALGRSASNTDRIAASAVSAVVGDWAGKIVAAAILISIFSAGNSIPLTLPRVFYAMAKDGLFFQKLAEVHPNFRTPVFAIVAGSLWAVVLTMTGTFQQLFTYVVFGGWIFYGLAAASVFPLRKRSTETETGYKVPGYPYTPVVFILAAAALVVNTIIKQPKESIAGLIIIATGVPAYFFWYRRRKRSLLLQSPHSG
ncbi:amino acid permease [bacterium]|nr:amino acid permease [bacterium]